MNACVLVFEYRGMLVNISVKKYTPQWIYIFIYFLFNIIKSAFLSYFTRKMSVIMYIYATKSALNFDARKCCHFKYELKRYQEAALP